MNKKFFFLFFLASALTAGAQGGWKKVDRLMEKGSYRTAFEVAQREYRGLMGREGLIDDRRSQRLLTAAWYMAQAGSHFEEDCYDSTRARYRAALPRLQAIEQAVCYAFLGVYDSALINKELLKRTPAKRLAMFVEKDRENDGVCLTPTVFDVVAHHILHESYSWDFESQERQLRLMKELIDFHAGDGDDLRIYLDLKWVEILVDMYDEESTDSIRVTLHREAIDKWRSSASPMRSLLYAEMADALEDGNKVEALRYCDSAIAFGTQCAGAQRGRIIKQRILSAHIVFPYNRGNAVTLPGKPSLHVVSCRNLQRIYLTVLPYSGKVNKVLTDTTQKPVMQWVEEVGDDGSHQMQSHLVVMPPLASGNYLLVASPQPRWDENSAYQELKCTDMIALDYRRGEQLLIDRDKGGPIVGQPVTYSQKDSVIATDVSNADGFVAMKKEDAYYYNLSITRDGYRIDMGMYNGRDTEKGKMQRYARLMHDRPVHRPGDTLHVAALIYETDGVHGHPCKGVKGMLMVTAPNGKVYDSLPLESDAYGMAHVEMVLPKDEQNGYWALQLKVGDETLFHDNVNVEEYKQPHFMVTIEEDSLSHRRAEIGKPYTLRGLARSYSGASMAGAKVRYEVGRDTFSKNGYSMSSTFSLEGEAEVKEEGTFEITIPIESDTLAQKYGQPWYLYGGNVIVTDLNGESHETPVYFVAGESGSYLELQREPEMHNLDTLRVSYTDWMGYGQKGDVEVTVERLGRPSSQGYVPSMLRSYYHAKMSIDSVEFSRLFPHFAADRRTWNHEQWPVVWRYNTILHADGRKTLYPVALPKEEMPAGLYRVVLKAGKTVDTSYVDGLTHGPSPWGEGSTEATWLSEELFWSDVDKTKASVGDTLTLRYGSMTGRLPLLLSVGSGDGELRREWITATDTLQQIQIVVDSAMLGGVEFCFYGAQYGDYHTNSHRVSVPFDHKNLEVSIATFRDRIQPGEEEEWTIVASPPAPLQGERGVECELVMTLYDAALDRYGMRSVGTLDHLWRHFYGRSVDIIGGWSVISGNYHEQLSPVHEEESVYRYKLADGFYAYADEVEEEIVLQTAEMEPAGTAYGESRAMRKSNVISTEEELEEVVIAEESVPVIEIGAPESGARLSADDVQRMPAAEVWDSEYSNERFPEYIKIRENMSTLAFFVAGLRSDAHGKATWRFTMPDALTTWQLRGLAVDADLRTGYFNKQLVTSKPLMVIPNWPRFMRQGDSIVLMAKVVVASPPTPLPGERGVDGAVVELVLTDARTGDTLSRQRQQVDIADGSGQALFSFKVPEGLYVAQYELRAVAGKMSDGERGQIAVLDNRQAVTVSKALFINGAGEKTFHFPLKEYQTATAQPDMLMAEVEDSPMRIALQAMPYLEETESPSTIYLANQLYVTRLAEKYREWYRSGGNEWTEMSDWDNSPYARQVEDEKTRRQRLAAWMDTARLERAGERLVQQLQQRQLSDGSWSWMPDGQGSAWVTQQVLQRIAEGLPPRPAATPPMEGTYMDNIERALKYIDDKVQERYEANKKTRQQVWTCGFDEVDYLYTRSYYGAAKSEAYGYYYDQVKKHYAKNENLMQQAQMALVLERGGDHREALDIIRRLKERSLSSDEMGLYWRDNRGGWWWYERPVETQAMLIRAFSEVTPDDTLAIGMMQQWLLKQKQTTHWGNDVATAKAIEALVGGGDKWKVENGKRKAINLWVFGQKADTAISWSGADLANMLASDNDEVVIVKKTPGIAWGAVYYRYTDEMEKIPASESGITLKRTYYRVDGEKKTPATTFEVGDRVRVQIEISCDRTMEYLKLTDGRPACVEPLSTASGWQWNKGLSYYVDIKNDATHCYVNRLEKGKYVVEYDVYVTNPGDFLAGAVTMECMYAPEFRAVAPATKIKSLTPSPSPRGEGSR